MSDPDQRAQELREEQRLLLKLSGETRQLWSDTLAVYSSPAAMRRPEPFSGLRSRLARLPANQRRYYGQLMRLHRARFERAALLTLSEDEFREMLDGLDERDLAFVARQLQRLAREHREDRPA